MFFWRICEIVCLSPRLRKGLAQAGLGFRKSGRGIAPRGCFSPQCSGPMRNPNGRVLECEFCTRKCADTFDLSQMIISLDPIFYSCSEAPVLPFCELPSALLILSGSLVCSAPGAFAFGEPTPGRGKHPSAGHLGDQAAALQVRPPQLDRGQKLKGAIDSVRQGSG